VGAPIEASPETLQLRVTWDSGLLLGPLETAIPINVVARTR